jgi:hypothetical protein
MPRAAMGSQANRQLVLGAMRSGEWLRTQWIARVAFGLGDGPWQPQFATKILPVLRELKRAGRVEERMSSESREGALAGAPIRFAIPRSEWRLNEKTRGPR